MNAAVLSDSPDTGHPVAVTRVTLTDFRSYRYARLETQGQSVVLNGANGAGKTNLLEALSFLVPGRGLRRAKLSDVIRRTTQNPAPAGWAMAARVATPDGVVEIGTGCTAEQGTERRAVHIDGQAQRGQAALSEHLGAVWLTPRMDSLFQDGAVERRRFLDRMIYGFDPAHAGRLNAWDHAARARSKLLREGNSDDAWCAALEDTMAQKGVAIAAARADMVARLNAACAKGVGPFPAATLALQGRLDQWLAEAPALATEDRLRTALAAARPRDGETGGASDGPHRSDLAVRHGAKDLPAEQCSTGEQKALLIALILADARIRTGERGVPPILLLDEVAAHLDEQRRAALYDEIRALDAQAWLTGTDRSVFAPLEGEACFVTVRDGTLSIE